MSQRESKTESKATVATLEQRSSVLKKELGLFDLVLTQIVFVVGTIWVGHVRHHDDHSGMSIHVDGCVWSKIDWITKS